MKVYTDICSIILDLIVIGIVILFMVLSAKKGFVKTIMRFLGFIAAAVLAFILCSPIANFTYDKIMKPVVTKTVEQGISGKIDDVADVWDALPKTVKNIAESKNITKQTLKSKMGDATKPAEVAVALSNNLVKPITFPILKACFLVTLFLILLIPAKFLAAALNKICSFNIVGKLNRNLGGILGILKGAVIAIAFILVFSAIISLSGGFLKFTPETINSTIIFKFVLNTFKLF